jgi:sterol desaturase/sphingolipid hydroxylase (fatty acid hydroxylase superfamily)
VNTTLLDYASLLASFVAANFAALLVPLHSSFSAASLFSSLCVAVAFIVLKRRPEKRSVKYAVMLRALFPRRLYKNRSFKADVAFFFFNVLASGMLLGWAMVSSQYISKTVSVTLTDHFGAHAGTGWNGLVGKSIATLAIFVAYELAYWVDHYLSHRIPLLWEFHKVHHTAEVLSPLTNFRVHPVDSIVFGNFLGLFIGATDGFLNYLHFGTPFGVGASASGILVAFMWVFGHLQHSHLWIAVTGRLGRVILSPAHHQIHHSDNPKHFNKNFGSCLSIWDWLFGTLHMPDRDREDLSFGVGDRTPAHHTAVGGMLTPFAMAWRVVRAATRPGPIGNTGSASLDTADNVVIDR